MVLIMKYGFDEEPVEAAIDIPIDRTEVIPSRVVSIVGEFQAGADLARPPFRNFSA